MSSKLNYALRSVVLILFVCYGTSAISQTPILKHAYSFNEGSPTDDVSGTIGELNGGAKIENGALVTSTQGQYFALPADEINISSYSSVTLEAFIVAEKGNGSYTMFSYFGNNVGNNGTDYLFQSLANGGGSKTAISCKNDGAPWQSEVSVRSLMLNDDQPHYVVTTFDNKELRFYIDGVFAGSLNTTDNPNNIIANLGTSFAFLGKGAYSTDPTWKGKIDQFNIYEGVLDSATIAQTATKYLPNLNLKQTAALLKGLSSSILVDDAGTFKQAITDEQIIFAELIPADQDGNNRIDEYLVFSDAPLSEWGMTSATLRLSSLSGYLDIQYGQDFKRNNDTQLEIEAGEVYQCWIVLNVPGNIYSLYAKTIAQEKPILIGKDAAFRKETTVLTHWTVMHNREVENDAMSMNALSVVKNIGDYPEGYSASTPAKKISVLDEVIPEVAMVVENPIHSFKQGRIELKKIAISEESTALYLRVYHGLSNAVSIPAKTYIQPVNSDKKLYITSTEGIPMGMNYYSTAKNYSDIKLIFPPIATNTTTFDYGEEGGGWFIYDIRLKPKDTDKENALAGNWCNTDSGDWEFSLLDSLAIYKNKVWKYTNFDKSKKKGEITLVDNDTEITLNYKRKKDQLSLSDNNGVQLTLDHKSNYSTVPNPTNPPVFTTPVFTTDTAVFSGYYHGYSTKIGTKTGTIHVDNILTGDQESYLVKINSNGKFSVKIPINYPHEVWVRMDHGISRLFLEPGKEVFMMKDLTQSSEPLLMGDNARLSLEFGNQHKTGFYMFKFYADINDTILGMTPEVYKNYCLLKTNEDLSILNKLWNTGKISDRYYQLVKMQIPFSYHQQIFYYQYSSENAYRTNNNIPREQRNIPIHVKLPSYPGFYDFLDADLMNNELSVLTNAYENLINAFMYSSVLNSNYSQFDLIDVFSDSTIVDSKDQESVNELLSNMTKEANDLIIEFNAQNDSIERQVLNAYSEKLIEFKNNKKDGEVPVLELYKHISTLDTLSAVHKAFCSKAIAYYSNPIVKNAIVFQIENSDTIRQLNKDYSLYLRLMRGKKRDKILQEQLNIETGLVSDLFNSQDILRMVVSEYTPLSSKQLAKSIQAIRSPYIQSYIENINYQTITKIEALKTKGGYTLNEVPETEADKVFEAIIGKYKGKVIYVDFWATWCGPCRSSMKNQKPMKEAFKGKDIVFVYITSPSSPENTYKNMIPDIPGEHFRVSQDEWNYLCTKFNISGIPRYLIVNKKGEVVDLKAPRDPDELSTKFNELLKE